MAFAAGAMATAEAAATEAICCFLEFSHPSTAPTPKPAVKMLKTPLRLAGFLQVQWLKLHLRYRELRTLWGGCTSPGGHVSRGLDGQKRSCKQHTDHGYLWLTTSSKGPSALDCHFAERSGRMQGNERLLLKQTPGLMIELQNMLQAKSELYLQYLPSIAWGMISCPFTDLIARLEKH